MHFSLAHTRVALVDFDKTARMASSYIGATTLRQLNNKIDNLGNSKEHIGNLYSALWLMRTGMLGIHVNGDRFNIKDFAIIITDSPFPPNYIVTKNMIYTGARLLRASGVGLFVIGIGPNVNKNDLLQVAGHEDYLYMVNDYWDLLQNDVLLQALARYKNLGMLRLK